MKTRLILNGKKAAQPEIREAVEHFRNQGYDIQIRVTWEYGDAIRLVRECVEEDIALVIAGGGDGTVNEVAHGLMLLEKHQRPAMAIMPLGTANDFATACEIPKEPKAALTFALKGMSFPIDMVKASDRYFINIASAGFGAAITTETPVELKNFLGGGAYTLMGIIKALNFTPYPGKLLTPELELKGEVIIGALCNGRQAGGGQILAPNAILNDGLLDVLLVLPFPLNKLSQVYDELINPSAQGEFVKIFQTPWLTAKREHPIPTNLDGEPISQEEICFEAVPDAIRLVLDKDCPCLKPLIQITF